MNAHRERARQLIELKKFDLAEQELRAALALEPNDASSHAALASCLLERKAIFQALSEAETAVGLEPVMHLQSSF
jgi:Flp pilus assembly protein TadD